MSKHKIFISYHHKNDQEYKEELEDIYCGWLENCISRSVQNMDIDDNLPDEKIREIIRDNYLKDSTVTVVLVGQETWQRKHVDWEIFSSLYDGVVNKRSGLIGVLLPSYNWSDGIDTYSNILNSISKLKKTEDGENFFPYTIPPRLYDNIQTGYAKIYSWDDFLINCEEYIDEAYKRKNNYSFKTDLSRERFKQNRSGTRWR